MKTNIFIQINIDIYTYVFKWDYMTDGQGARWCQLCCIISPVPIYSVYIISVSLLSILLFILFDAIIITLSVLSISFILIYTILFILSSHLFIILGCSSALIPWTKKVAEAFLLFKISNILIVRSAWGPLSKVSITYCPPAR